MFFFYAHAMIPPNPRLRRRTLPVPADGNGVERHREKALNGRDHDRDAAAPAAEWTQKLNSRSTAAGNHPRPHHSGRERAIAARERLGFVQFEVMTDWC